jgi:hypothetical protein
MRRVVTVLLVIAGVSTPAISAHALLGGSLSVTAPTTASLGSAPTTASTVSGSLGPVKVTDTRTLGLGWTAKVSSASFTGSGLTVIPKSSVTYISGTATATSGVVTPVPGPALGVTLDAQKTAFSASVGIAGGTVTWNPTIRVALPVSVLAGNYSGTITHSVS